MQTRQVHKKWNYVIYTLITVLILMLVKLLWQLKASVGGFEISKLSGDSLIQGFGTVMISIILEALPFVILGVIISSLINIFVSEETVARLLPSNKITGILIASMAGFIFPVCECAIVPIARRLIKKGVPVCIAVTFMIAVPIVNPIVLLSTYYAFSGEILMVALRGGIGLVSAILVGIIVSYVGDEKSILKDSMNNEHTHTCSCGCCSCNNHTRKGLFGKIQEILAHISDELLEIGRFLILGASIAALFQVGIDRGFGDVLGSSTGLSVVVMIVIAFIISLCSEADAFIARTFVGQFTTGSIVAFLVFGPMMDIKNALMMSMIFKKSFIIKLIAIIFGVCFLMGVGINLIGITVM